MSTSKESVKKSVRGNRRGQQSVATCRSTKTGGRAALSADGSTSVATLNKDLQHHLSINAWYHGLMPRDEIERYLKSDGDFLLRKTEVNGKPRIAISVLCKGRVRHILLSTRGNEWCIRQVRKPTLVELVEHHMREKTPVQAEGTLLVTPIARPNHVILHEHVIVEKKLGRGAFGDVHRGLLKTLGSGVFSTKSDVWAYGVLLWEVFTRCKTEPFAELHTPKEVKAHVMGGKEPLPPPEGTPPLVATVMRLCFTHESKDRPEFVTLLKLLAPDEKPPT
ncbi:Tyrosine-protein kinase [Aphelenchoides fujianensis]|nr:Tyrosine-protein kinase [Aphelenchoides fujianensis]